jgi:hypothetical protein
LSIADKFLGACVSLKTWAEKQRANIATNGLFSNDRGEFTMMDYLVGVAIAVIILVAVFALAPVIGSNIDNAATISPDSQWNATVNPDIKTGVDLWTQFSGLIILAGLVSLLSLVIWAIMRIRGGGQNSGGGGI